MEILRPTLRRSTGLTALIAAVLFTILGPLAAQPAAAAALTVTSAADSGPGTLRDRVNAAGTGDTITFSSALNGVPITLTSAGIVIDTDMTIRGNGPASTIIKRAVGAPNFPVLTVFPSLTATVDMVTVTGGQATGDGGGILVEGTLNLSRSTIVNNRAMRGGGVANLGGKLTVTNTEITDNTATAPAGAEALGGGISSQGLQPLTVTNSALSGNTADGGTARGGGIVSSSPTTLTDSLVASNNATANDADATVLGGGVAFFGVSGLLNVAIVNSVIGGNAATKIPVGGSGGALGGGLALFETTATLDRVEVSENNASAPGGFAGGGGVYMFSATTITNSTIAANSATRGAGLLAQGTTSLRDSTVAANVSSGAAIETADPSPFTEEFTIVDNPLSSANCAGTITDGGHNLWFGGTQGTCPGVNANPNLGPLASNGGVSRTMALNGPGGIDTGGLACLPTDQRGFPRVGTCDAGAYEANSTLADNTPPACSLLGVALTNPKQQSVTVADSGRGLQAISGIAATNAVVVVPYFLKGTRLQVVVTAVKVNQALSSWWRFNATDRAANKRLCT